MNKSLICYAKLKKEKLKNTNEFIMKRTLVSISFQLFPLHSICNINHKCQSQVQRKYHLLHREAKCALTGPYSF